jgi:uncharacterized protein (TIGR03435 family)
MFRLTIALLASLCWAQDSFEVVSIKPVAATDNRVMIRQAPGGRFTANGANVRMLIGMAYEVRDFQISGGPSWISDDRFEINAKADTEQDRIPREQFQKMLKNMLTERFGLKIHEEEKEGSVYHLVQSKSGVKMPENKETGQGNRMFRMGRGQINANGIPMGELARSLSQMLGRQVIDKTGLTANYDVELQWTPEPGQGAMFGMTPPPGAAPPVDNSGPTIYTALEEKLGLKLESAKGPLKVLVIDSVTKPSEN